MTPMKIELAVNSKHVVKTLNKVEAKLKSIKKLQKEVEQLVNKPLNLVVTVASPYSVDYAAALAKESKS